MKLFPQQRKIVYFQNYKKRIIFSVLTDHKINRTGHFDKYISDGFYYYILGSSQAFYGVIIQSVIQSFLKTPVCGALLSLVSDRIFGFGFGFSEFRPKIRVSAKFRFRQKVAESSART